MCGEGAETPPHPHTRWAAGLGVRRNNRNWSRRRGPKPGRRRKVPANIGLVRGLGGTVSLPQMHPGLRRLPAGCSTSTSRQLGARPAWANQRAKPTAGGGAGPKLRAPRLRTRLPADLPLSYLAQPPTGQSERRRPTQTSFCLLSKPFPLDTY